MRIVLALALLAAAGTGLWWLYADRHDRPVLVIEDATASPIKGALNSVMVSVTIRNDGGPDQLLDASAAGTKVTVLKAQKQTGAPIPGGTTATLGAEGTHVMMMGLPSAASSGALLPLTLTFARSGDLAIKAKVTDTAMMHHSMGPAPDGPVPALQIAAVPDIDGGWTIAIDASNFTFNPDAVDGPHVAGQGHGHLYLDGVKLGRVFQSTARIGALLPGTYTVQVTLNANDHRPYAANGKPISATTDITVP